MARLASFVCVAGLVACQVYDPLPPNRGSMDGGSLPDASRGPDTGVDGGADSGKPPPADAGSRDAGADARMPPVEAGADASQDAATDARVDAAPSGDAGEDAAPIDECPNDPSKTAPGTCGCGIPETCLGLISALGHRYRFAGTGTTVTDAAGTAHGASTVALTGNGLLEFSGAAYATLPAGLLSGYAAATIEFWVTWQGGSQRQRVFSFGTAAPTRPAATCAANADFFSGSWYHFCTKDGTMTWSKARGLCEGAGGFLASIDSAPEDQYLDSHPSFVASAWIGANDLQTEGQWYFANAAGLQGGTHFWSGDESGSAVGGAFADWRTDAPNPDDSTANIDCSFLYKQTSSWMAYGCEFDGDFVCEWRGHQGASLSRGVSFTPSSNNNRPTLTFQAGAGAVVAQGATAFPTATLTHVALVLEPASDRVALYIGGALAASAATSDALANLRDADNWLSRSHLSGDPSFAGSLSELRIYTRALSADEIAISRTAGPEPSFLATGPQ